MLLSRDFILSQAVHDNVKLYLMHKKARFEISDVGDGYCCVSIWDATKSQMDYITDYLVNTCEAYYI